MIDKLSATVLISAGQDLFAVSYADAVENAGGRFPAGCRINDYTPAQPAADLLPIMRQWVECVDRVWPMPVAHVFDAMGLREDTDRARALYYLIMGCLGHGVGLWDDHADLLDNASQILGASFDPAPIMLDSCPLDDLADHEISRHGLGDLT